MSKVIVLAAGQTQLLNPNGPVAPTRSKQSLIEWPTGREIHKVSRRLAVISRIGARWEAEGDYFKSGDLAYQVHEIIQATAELFKKSRRIKR